MRVYRLAGKEAKEMKEKRNLEWELKERKVESKNTKHDLMRNFRI
jgi:hypothetical protein